MSDFDLHKKLKQLKFEDRVWLIYIGIIFLSWYSNDLERNYFLFNDKISKEKYRLINIIVFSILIIIYFYFLKESINDIKCLKQNDTSKKKTLAYLSFYGSLFIMISGIIFLYIAVLDNNLDTEIAFN